VEVLAPYLLKMLQPAVTEIIGKTQKKQYDQLDMPKLIGYFEKDSKGMPYILICCTDQYSMPFGSAA
jgi:hypothetical protein